jgi:hypothetical protein
MRTPEKERAVGLRLAGASVLLAEDQEGGPPARVVELERFAILSHWQANAKRTPVPPRSEVFPLEEA